MTTTTDFVVAGGGHNSLITAAYLAKAGHEVIVLDARSEAGGGAATDEILLPGFGFDTCSTGHTLIQVNPLLSKDNADRVKLNTERVKHWLSVGAQPTDRVMRFLDAAGLVKRTAGNNPNKGKPKKKRMEREAAAAEAASKKEEGGEAKPAA